MAKGARWEWWEGRWDERDICGAFTTMESVETGEAESLCRNGGSTWGPFSRFMRDQDQRVREEYAAYIENALQQAEAATNGYMAKKTAPKRYHGADAWYPMAGRPPSARHASDELLEHWREGGDRWMTYGEFKRGYQEQFAPPGEW